MGKVVDGAAFAQSGHHGGNSLLRPKALWTNTARPKGNGQL